jgi:hypothetical protein
MTVIIKITLVATDDAAGCMVLEIGTCFVSRCLRYHQSPLSSVDAIAL